MRNFKRFILKDFLGDLNNCSWGPIEETDDVDTAYTYWKTIFNEVCNKHCPFISRRVRKNFLPWLNDDIKEDIKMKHYFMKKAHSKGLEIYWLMFKHFRIVISNSLRIAKKEHYTGLILENKNKPKIMWKYLKELLPGKSCFFPNNLLIDGQIITNRKHIANAFNSYFTSIASKLAKALSPPTRPITTNSPALDGPIFNFPAISPDFVEKQLISLPENKAVGFDKLSGKLLKAAAPAIAKPLSIILNLSLQSGKFIADWKHAKVIPLHKTGPTTERNNYRPISILPILSKILERFVHMHFSTFLDLNNLLATTQSGFRKQHSTTTALLNVTERWFKNIDKGLVTGIVFVDLRKAFDTVDIHILLDKLPQFGVTGKEHSWFKSYLTSRFQSVAFGGQISEPMPVSIGVPQGSILGPLLFLLYLNDLPSVPDHCNVGMYADDTEIDAACCPAEVETLEQQLNNDLCKLNDYLNANRLNTNIPKCQFMKIGTHQVLNKCEDIKITIKDQQLDSKTSFKYLGMIIDQNLNWDAHIDYIVPKISTKIGIIRSLRRTLPVDTLKLLFNAIVLPHFDYVDIIYDSTTKTNKERLQKLQTRAARIISGSGPRTHRAVMFKSLGWLSLQQRRNVHKCVMIYKCRNNLAPDYLRDLFFTNDDTHSYNTRNAADFRLPKTRTEFYRRSFLVSSQLLWNNLPNNLKQHHTLNSFKNATFKHFYSLPQF